MPAKPPKATQMPAKPAKSGVFAPKLFRSSGASCVYQVSTHLFCFGMHLCSRLFALFYPTHHEAKDLLSFAVQSLLRFPVYFAGTVLLLPVTVVCGVLAFLLEFFRQTPFRYMQHLPTEEPPTYKRQYSIATSNVCLASEIVSKVNNLAETQSRARKIGEIFTQHSDTALSSGETIVSEMPELDFICFQEVWDVLHAETLVKQLKKKFRYFVYDVGAFRYPLPFNSGLSFASKYPIIDAQYRSFGNCIKQCRLTRKGVLSVKVLLGHDAQGRRHVAYISDTHLQALQGKHPIHELQMDQVRAWTAEFKRLTVEPIDWVDFECICGDFNFDNSAPVDKHMWNHPIFDSYVDPARDKPGQDHHWAIGTDRRLLTLHDEAIASPEGYRKALVDPRLRRRYVYDGDVETADFAFVRELPHLDDDGLPRLSPVGGRRRIDYQIFHREHPVTVIAHQFATNLAGLTDHVPVCTSFQVRAAL